MLNRLAAGAQDSVNHAFPGFRQYCLSREGLLNFER